MRKQQASDSLILNTDRALRKMVAERPQPDEGLHIQALRLLAKSRHEALGAVIHSKIDGRIISGPFQGMWFVPVGSHGSITPKLLGTYEHELHPVIEEIVALDYRHIAVIGCAEGYYAAGLALRLPKAKIEAYDIDNVAMKWSALVVEKNAVRDRVTLGQMFEPGDFARLPAGSLVMCDIEGAECELLDPVKTPSLAQLDIVVECHDNLTPGLSKLLAERFSQTHSIKLIELDPLPAIMPNRFVFENELDRLLAIWEWREGSTPWLWMQANKA